MKILTKRILSMVLALCLLLAFAPTVTMSANAAAYDVSAAVAFANSYWNDGVGLCAEFVSRCLNAGGVTIPNSASYYSTSTQSYQNNSGTLDAWHNPYIAAPALLLYLSEHYPVITNPSASQISVGDVVFMNGGSSGAQKDAHVGIIISTSGGVPVYAAHNRATNTGKFYSSYPCTYVVKMSTAEPERELDATYADYLPIAAYPIPTDNISVYDAYGTAYSNRYITGSTDLCIIHEIYTDGWCYISYPSSAESDGYFEAYVKLSTFIGSTSTSKWTSTGNYTAYRRSDLSATIGSVSSGDACLVVNTSGNLKQVIYPVTGSGYYKMGWIEAEHTHTYWSGYEADHPHRVYMKCDCGDSYYTGETQSMDGCTLCTIPGKPVLKYTISNNQVTFTWEDTENTTHYNLWIEKKDASGEWESVEQVFYAETGLSRTLAEGEYRVQLLSYNSDAWESDGSDWKHTWADDVFFTITPASLTGLSVAIAPTKTSYYVGDTLDTTGMKLTVGYSYGENEEITTGFTCSPTTLSTAGTQTITVTYKGKSTTFTVEVSEVTLTGLSVATEPQYTVYYLGGASLNTTGLTLTATYSNGTTQTITSGFTCSPTTFTAVGTQTVTVSYGGLTTSFPVEVRDMGTMTVGSASGEPGELVTVPVTMTYNPGIIAARLSVYFDHSAMELVAVKDGGILGEYIFGNDMSADPYTVVWENGLASENYTETGTLVYFTFRIVDDATAGQKKFMVGYYEDEIYDINMENVAFAVSQGSITVEEAEEPSEPNPDAPQFVVSTETAKAGDQVEVTVAVKNNPGITSIKLKVSFDPALTLTKVTYNTDIGGMTMEPNQLNSPVTLNWFDGISDVEGDWVYATLTFQVSGDAQADTLAAVSVTYDPDDIYDITETNICFSVVNGGVQVIAYTPGDINGDGKVNNKDVTRLFQYVSGYDVELSPAADVNGDGKINNKDVTRLFQYVSGYDVELH